MPRPTRRAVTARHRTPPVSQATKVRKQQPKGSVGAGKAGAGKKIAPKHSVVPKAAKKTGKRNKFAARKAKSASPLTAVALYTGNVRQALGLPRSGDATQQPDGKSKAKARATRIKPPVFNVAMDDEIFVMLGKQPFLHRLHGTNPILSRLYLGNYGAVLDNDLLAANDISVMINAIKGWKYKKSHQKVVAFPLNDTHSQPLSLKLLHTAADTIHNLLSSGERVMVHCVYGMNRSSTLVAAYLIKYHHYTTLRAKRELSEVRGVEVLTNDAFRNKLRQFQKLALADTRQ